MDNTSGQRSINPIFLISLKYCFSVVVTLLSYRLTHSWQFVFVGLLELAIIFVVTDLIAVRNTVAANVFNDSLLLLYNLETMILCFSGERLRLIMLENIPSLRALSGELPKYCIGLVCLLIVSFIPVHSLNSLAPTHIGKKSAFFERFLSSGMGMQVLSVALSLELVITLFFGNSYSALFSLKSLYDEYQQKQALSLDIENQPDMTERFYKNEIVSYTDISPTESDRPNIVLIFVEGLSQNIIDDERNIMPNARQFESDSINFVNYFNHTAATYRGIISQLYSGYQRNNLDTNSLVSMQSILSDYGYTTAFINTEPKNHDFSRYLNNLGFDTVLTDDILEGPGKSISDKHAFELLMDTMEDLDSDSNPFFLSI